MKNIDIKNMNAKQRLVFAHWMAKFYGRQTLLDIVDNYKYSYESDREAFKIWFNVTTNMYKMRGITFIGKYNILY